MTDTMWRISAVSRPPRDDRCFRRLLLEAHRRGMRVIVDLILNHTSDQHAWFQSARILAGLAQRDYYVWSNTDQRYGQARIIFVDTEKSNWTWDPEAQAYYLASVFSHQPDLNYDSPKVRQAMLEVWNSGWIRDWTDSGATRFPTLFEREGTMCGILPKPMPT